MSALQLHEFHERHGAHFGTWSGMEIVSQYGSPASEYRHLTESVAILDLGFRGRLCLTGADRQKFLNGQVTNNVKELRPGQGCYAAIINAKGKMQSDLNIYCLEDELLLDFEPGLQESLSARLDKYIIADDVQIVSVHPHYQMLSLQGPRAATLAQKAGLSLPNAELRFVKELHPVLGEIYLAQRDRSGCGGFDLFVGTAAIAEAAQLLTTLAPSEGGSWSGMDALEQTRIEAGIPRFGIDISEANLPPEAGLDQSAISYSKGCYIGQEVIARIRTYGQVAKALRGLRFTGDPLPRAGDKLYAGEKEVGYVTSSAISPRLQASIGLGYVRRECNQPGTILSLHPSPSTATVCALPFIVRGA